MFNLEQLEELEKVFAKQHNIVGKKRAQLAAQLNLTENQVRAGTPVGLGLHPGTGLLSQKTLSRGWEEFMGLFLCARLIGHMGPNHWHTPFSI